VLNVYLFVLCIFVRDVVTEKIDSFVGWSNCICGTDYWMCLVQQFIDSTNGRVADWSGNCVYLPAGDRGAAVLPHTSEADEPTLLRVLGISTE